MRPPVPEKGVHIVLERFPRYWKSLSFQGKMVMRSIFRNRFRSLVTIVAAILATALIFSALEFFDAMYKMIDFSFDTVQHQDFTLSLRDPLGAKILQPLTLIPGVKQLESQLSVPATLTNGPYIKKLSIIGVPKSHSLFTPVDKKNNRIRIDNSGLVINQTLANILHIKRGDMVLLRPLIGTRTLKKVKIKQIIKTYLGLSVYANQTWLSHLIGDSWVTNGVLFKLHKNANTNLFIQKMSQFAPMINLTSEVRAKNLVVETLNRFLMFFVIMMIGFSAIIAMGAVINTAIISLNERERDVASLRILGFSNTQVAQIFFKESLLLNIIGIFFGLFAGIGYVYYMSVAFSTEIYRMPMIVRIPRLIESALIMLLFVLISQTIIYNVIRKLNWLEVLNNKE